MAYTPDTLTVDTWSTPSSILASDLITDLDNTINSIIDTDSSSIKNHINTEMAKIPTYLSSELAAMYADIDAGILSHDDYATATTGGTIKMHYDSGTSTLTITNDGTDAS